MRNSRLPKYVYVQRIKGRTYYRFRRGSKGGVRLPDDPASPEFHAAYAKLLSHQADVGRYAPGSVAHTIERYLNSGEFEQLAPATQRDYRRYLYRLDKSVGERAIAALDNEYVFAVRDRLKATPIGANHAVVVIRALFKFARSRRLTTTDPTLGVPKLKGGGGYRIWDETNIARFRVSASPRMRLAFELGLYTGQRLSDVIRLAWSNYDGARIRLRQQKTGTSMTIPVHPDLKPLLDAAPRSATTILATKTGRSYHPRVFSREFREARLAAGTDSDLSFHGLRHTAAARLAELGAGAPEIAAITGHKSLKLVEHYIRQANQEVQADRAIARLPRR